jgi:hypothetical protein
MLNPLNELYVYDVVGVHMLSCGFVSHPFYERCNSVLLSEMSHLVATTNSGSVKMSSCFKELTVQQMSPQLLTTMGQL